MKAEHTAFYPSLDISPLIIYFCKTVLFISLVNISFFHRYLNSSGSSSSARDKSCGLIPKPHVPSSSAVLPSTTIYWSAMDPLVTTVISLCLPLLQLGIWGRGSRKGTQNAGHRRHMWEMGKGTDVLKIASGISTWRTKMKMNLQSMEYMIVAEKTWWRSTCNTGPWMEGT